MSSSVDTIGSDFAFVSTSLIDGFFHLRPREAAGVLESSSPDEAARLLATGETSGAAAVAMKLTPEFLAGAVRSMAPAAAASLLGAMDQARAAMVLARFDDDEREPLLAALPPREATELRELISYPPDRAGGLMDPRVHTFHDDATVAEAISRLRGSIEKRIYDVFLVDEEGKLTGYVPVQQLAVSEEDELLGTLSRAVPDVVQAIAPRDEVAEILEGQTLTTLPVVDFEGKLLGVIRQQRLVEVIEREASADMQSMVGVSPEERALSGVSFSVRKRLPWLQINLATAFLAASVVGLFEDTIAKFTALAVLLPVVAGQSGNTGSQALAVTLRGLALREIRLSHWPRVVFKEASVGAINGLAVALVTAAGVYVWSRSAGLSGVIALAMVASMAIAGVTGALIPMILSAVGQDPAQSSSIVLTTITDITGFFSFLGLATLFAGVL